jgi:nicotinamidase-related amidase
LKTTAHPFGGLCGDPRHHRSRAEMQRLVAAFRRANVPIVHAVRIYRPDASNADPYRREAIERGLQVVLPRSEGAELVDELKPSPGVKIEAERLLGGDLQQIGDDGWVMYKPRWGAFYRTSLEEHLRDLGANTIVVCGCNFPNCPRATIYEACERDFRIVLVADAVSGLYERGSRELENIGVALMNTDGCLGKLDAVRNVLP